MISTINLPANFAAAMQMGRLASMADVSVSDAFDQFARGLARVACGRLVEARGDFEAAREDVGDAARLEIALLDLQVPGRVAHVEQTAEQLARDAPVRSMLSARARHVLGLARNKLGNLTGARAALLEALSGYQELDCELGHAQVRDSLGSVLADCGRLDDAAHHYSLSVATKAKHGDLDGLAISLGNLGRVQLRAGRVEAAIECFQADLRLIEGRTSDRTRARVLNDLARAELAGGNASRAIGLLIEALRLARARQYDDVACLALKDLTLAYVAVGDFERANQSLQQGKELLPANAESYLWAYWRLASGTVLGAEGNDRAAQEFAQAREQFHAVSFVEGELEAVVGLARAFIEQKDARSAEIQVLQGLELARSSSFHRLVPELNKLLFDLARQRETNAFFPFEGELGAIASRFVPLSRLGGGAFGEVFRVFDNARLAESALKIIRLGNVYDSRTRQRLKTSIQRELQVGLQTNHPGVARVLEVGELHHDAWFILQELVQGKSLDSFMRGAKGDIKLGLELFTNIAFALDCLHGEGVVHCDIKPANIILRPTGTPVLIDFGIAQVSGRGAGEATSIMGSTPYMSPEQASGAFVDCRSDIYSLGILAFEWFAGERPLTLRGSSPQELAKLIESTPPLLLRRLRPDAPLELESTIDRALAKSPRQRFPSARQFAEAMQSIWTKHYSKGSVNLNRV